MAICFNKSKKRIYKITIVSVLASLSTIFFLIGGIPIFIMFPNLKVDLSDIPALIGGIVISPWAGLLIELIKNSIHLLKTYTLGIGEFMALVIGSSIVLSCSLMLKWLIKKKSLQTSMLISYIFCVIFTCLVAIVANSVIYPLFLSSISSGAVVGSVMSTYMLAVVIVSFVRVSITVFVSYLVVRVLNIKFFN